MRNNKVRNLAFSSMVVAVNVVICAVASFFSTMSLAITAISGIVIAFLVLQCGYKYSLLAYIASAVLAILLTPNKECAIYYALLFGHYPILKLFLQRIEKKFFVWLIKLLAANVLYAVVFVITTYIIGVSEVIGNYEFYITMLLFNIAFVLYDICLDKLMLLYLYKYQGKGKFR